MSHASSRRRRSATRAFPLGWEADGAVSRRQLMRLVVATSSALFAGSFLFTLLGRKDGGTSKEPLRIEGADALEPGKALYFHYPDGGDQAVLLNLGAEGFVAYSQKCTHLSCAVYFKEEARELICPCHNGKFSAESGEPIAGPPQRRLAQIRVEQRGSDLYAMEAFP